MLNKRGQTLILFVVLIPVFLMIFALVVDMGLVVSKKVELQSISKTVLNEIKENKMSLEEAKNLFNQNKIATDNLEIEETTNTITLKNETTVKSIFGAIVGFKEYKIKVNLEIEI